MFDGFPPPPFFFFFFFFKFQCNFTYLGFSFSGTLQRVAVKYISYTLGTLEMSFFSGNSSYFFKTTIFSTNIITYFMLIS